MCELLCITDDEDIEEFKLELDGKNMLKENKICWLDLSKLIRTSHNLEPTNKDVMIQYYETVEYIYEEMFSYIELLEKITNFG